MKNRNRAARSAFINRKSWNSIGHKGYAKRFVSKAERRSGKFICYNFEEEFDYDEE
jgi:hypothetical protein